MSDESIAVWASFIIGVLIATFLTLLFFHGSIFHRNAARGEAIEIGVAEYYLDENNDKQFRWKEPCDD